MKYFKSGKYKMSEVKAEYKRLSKIHHPDKPTGSTESFQELNNEYQIILENHKKKQQRKGNKQATKDIDKELKTVSDLINKYIPKEYQQMAKTGAVIIGNAILKELTKRLK